MVAAEVHSHFLDLVRDGEVAEDPVPGLLGPSRVWQSSDLRPQLRVNRDGDGPDGVCGLLAGTASARFGPHHFWEQVDSGNASSRA